MAGEVFIGIDGGGTQCRARIRDSAGRLLGEGTGGPANARLDPRLVMGSILAACRSAADAGGLEPAAIEGAHAGLGLAGAALPEARAALLAERHPFASVALDTDAYAAWLGAFGGGEGAILILGTGSCGFAIVGGRRHYVGGWGAELSDEASGAAIGREALRQMLRAHDGRAGATPLTDALFASFGGDPQRVVAFATTARPGDYARFAPQVFDHALRGDPLGAAIVAEAAGEVALIVDRLVALGAPAVCLTGGLAAPLAPFLPERVLCRLAAPLGDAMEGALAMAREGARALAAAE